MSKFMVVCDGGYRQQVNIGAWAFVIVRDDCDIMASGSGAVCNSTNNQCEYMAVLRGIEYMGKYVHQADSVEVVSDSQLVINQIANGWKINNLHLMKLHAQVMIAGKKVFGSVSVKFTWSSRENQWNQYVDKMCDDTIDAYIVSGSDTIG